MIPYLPIENTIPRLFSPREKKLDLIKREEKWRDDKLESWTIFDTVSSFSEDFTLRIFHNHREKKSKETIFGLEVPNELSSLISLVERSKYILDLKDDWDENGSKPYFYDTWEKSARFVTSFMIDFWRKSFVKPVEPNIYHAPESSIDIFWKTENFTLLINIPRDITKKATFSGKNNLSGDEIKGSLDTSKSADWLISWME